MKPIIGMPSRVMSDATFLTKANYIQAVSAFGGIPVQLPDLKAEDAVQVVQGIDGLLLTGGWDVAPLLYGEQPHKNVTRTCRNNDLVEMALLREAIAQGKPVLGICRGIQVINVCLGGTLYQDIPMQTGSTICHYQDAAARGEMTHTVQVEEGSHLAKILGSTQLEVNSYHHQCVKDVAQGLRATIHAPDGLIEGVENEDCSILAVQWHPESLYLLSQAHANLFISFLDRCKRAR